MKSIIWLDDQEIRQRSKVGGKGLNLGHLAAANLPVPPAFVVPTHHYRKFVESTGIERLIEESTSTLNYDDIDALEAATSKLRASFDKFDFPIPIERSIAEGYRKLGADDAYVAVRSSGTAEDTAEASFAGLHDTFLDVRGERELFAAIKQCWASLWTARATAYRHRMEFDHAAAELAVVIQVMIEAEVAGVMFTANPLTGATDETVINASWGLGESVVSGTVTPDEIVVSNVAQSIRRQTVGDKQTEIVRDPDAASGTIVRENSALRRDAMCMSAVEVKSLAAMGRQVMSHYDGMPQDIEWAHADNNFYLLQARDVTGIHFAWDEQVDRWQDLADDEETVWSRAFADEWWTGAVTPLFYSIRAEGQTRCHQSALAVMGLTNESTQRIFKYSNAEVYWNASLERREVMQFIPRFLRSPAALGRVPPAWWTQTIDAPFSWPAYLQLVARLSAKGMGPSKWIDTVYYDLKNRTADANGLSETSLRQLDDEVLKVYLDSRISYFIEFNRRQWAGFFLYAPGFLLLLGDILARWYGGRNEQAYADLLTGLPQQTITLLENEQLWNLAQMIRHSDALMELFNENTGADFFSKAAQHSDGKTFSASYEVFLSEHGHRGQADRDFWFPRRIENPANDYNAFKVILNSPTSTSPKTAEDSTRVRRESAIDEVLDNLRGQTFGFAKAKLFTLVLHHVYRFLQVRDDERHYIDRITWSKKKALLEINRRLIERGVLKEKDDYFFLSKRELYDRLDDGTVSRLTRAKIAGRRHNFDRFDRKEVTPRAFISCGQSIDLGHEGDAESAIEGELRGTGTSRGLVSGPARVIKSLDDIGRIQQGDILVCQATDPGWTPAFLVIGGLVLETGGLLAHGSCLSREYGLPAVQLPNAMSLIADGSLIEVNGETGIVSLPG